MSNATETTVRTVTATVTAYEGPEPCDWEGYVLEQLEQLYPGAEIEVSYGSKNAAFVDGEPLSDFSALCSGWWDDLCSQPNHSAWGSPEWSVKATAVRPSTTTDHQGAVDADVVITIGDETFEGSVTLVPDLGRPTVRRRHPFATWGDCIDVWAEQPVIDAIVSAEAMDIERTDVIGEIEASVNALAEA